MLKIVLLKLLFIIVLPALVYEDAEDLTTKRWTIVSPKYKGKVSNIFDKIKKSNVIKLDGNGTKSIYQLVIPSTLENIQMNNSFFTWEMNFFEDFVILILIDTIEGKRHLIYTPDGKNSYLQYGLNYIEKGKWKKYSRNLEKDLQIYEQKNKIIDIKGFVIKGSGFVDNIQLKKLHKKTVRTKPKPIPKAKIKAKVLPLSYKNDILPVLKLNGKNPILLKVGEEYLEEGASAKNRDGSEINISITHSIDILLEGEYIVIYIATNKFGNSSIDKRQVVVGKLSKKSHEPILEKCEELPMFLRTPKDEDAELEKALKEIEKKSITRPERPGL